VSRPTDPPPPRRTGGLHPSRWAPSVILVATVIAVWETYVRLADVSPRVLPAPSRVAAQGWAAREVIAGHAASTLQVTLMGFGLALVVSWIIATAVDFSPRLRRAVVPLLVISQTVPIVALAPVLGTMFGAASETPRQVVVAIAAFVPIFVNTLRGLRRSDPVHRDLLRANGASGWQITWHLTLPGALPYVFTGLNVASSLAVISAVVAEYFGGLQNGLGSRIASAAAQSGYARAWSYVLAAVVLGLLFYCVTLLLERSRARASST